MSGGHFNYAEFSLVEISEILEESLANNIEHGMSEDIIKCVKDIKNQTDTLYKILHELDYLYSSDIGEESFLERYQELTK